MYKFKMTIGDWSDDGHGRYEEFLISSNKPVESVREAHYGIKEATGIDIEAICAEYGNDTVEADVVKRLAKLGFRFDKVDGRAGTAFPSTDEMAELWMFLLRKSDCELKLQYAREQSVPTLHFSGADERGRQIGQIGYGLFRS